MIPSTSRPSPCSGCGRSEQRAKYDQRRRDILPQRGIDLVEKYGVNGTDLVTVGYGKNKLKEPGQPMAEANRRVQVVNMENKATASK